MSAYHTALANGQVEPAPPAQRADFSDGIALCHNVWLPLPPEYAACDVMYAEPPWRHGYDVFNERAGAHDPPWGQFMRRIADLIAEQVCPVAITAGKGALPYLQEPTNVYPTQLNGGDALLLCYNMALSNTATSEQAIDEICQRYNTIGDWCCGYGRTAIIARAHNKRFVISDHNASCVGYISEAFAV